MNWMKDALEIHAEAMETAAGECVVYRRGARAIEVMSTLGETVFEVQQEGGTFIEFRTQDFIIKQSELDFGVGPVDPERKDEIDLIIGQTTKTFVVLPTPGIRHFRTADSHGIAFRIHTKEKPSS